MKTSPTPNHLCGVCGEKALTEVMEFADFPRVTSDSKPFAPGGQLAICNECGTIQKLVEPKWLDEIDHIYSNFEIYHQADGAEQPIFSTSGSGGKPRSAQLVDFLQNTKALGTTGDILDFGCGNGMALRTFASQFPDWALYGSELSDTNRETLAKIPGFVELFTVPADKISARFDLITMIHSLEHIIEPVQILRTLGTLLKPGGLLFVEIPDIAQTPYDLLIADHLTHFTPESLGYACDLAGLSTSTLKDDLLPKELTWLGQADGTTVPTKPDPAKSFALVDEHLSNMRALMDQAKNLADRSSAFGVFGTSISATWMAGFLGDHISFYVDEDPGRTGRKHMGKPVFAPGDIPEDTDVLVPLIPKVASSVAERLTRPKIKFHTPTSVGSTTNKEHRV